MARWPLDVLPLAELSADVCLVIGHKRRRRQTKNDYVA